MSTLHLGSVIVVADIAQGDTRRRAASAACTVLGHVVEATGVPGSENRVLPDLQP
jgi:hypothetical protein